MKALKEKIQKEAYALTGNIIKVDNFLNHQIDPAFLKEIGAEFKNRFSDSKINKIITIEASGIAIALSVANQFNDCPVVFAKKTTSANMNSSVYQSEVRSYTRKNTYIATIAKEYLNKDDIVLIVDDFLAEGDALFGLIDIVKQSKAQLIGCGIVIEKGFQNGGKRIRDLGIRLESLAIIESVHDMKIKLK